MYVIVVVDMGSNDPTVDTVFGPFDTLEAATLELPRAERLTVATVDDLVKVVRVDTLRDPL